MTFTSAQTRQILKKYWGFDSFRPLQEDIINSILSGQDTLGLMPTGGGKSLTFQVPGLCFPHGLTIVVTPLISLMKDQVDNLKKHRVKAVSLHSGMSRKETRIAWEHLVNGKARFLYVSPEKLQNERFVVELRNLKVNFITVDEAHCLSQWGYDFRPSYLNIKKLRKVIPDVPVLALTATATPVVAADIMKQLEFKQPLIFKKSFVRDNISYIVRNSDTKIHELLHILAKTAGSSIVYVRSRKKTKEISDYLNNSGISATYYHAGLDTGIKTERQNAWKSGEVRVMVATNAFGMGIDKADVRVVIHFDLPPSLEEYYQEAGRAGRDGKKSYAVLLSSKSDKGILHRRVTEAFPERKRVKETYEQICNHLHISIGEGYDSIKEFDIERFCELFKKQEKECRSSLRLLSQAGYLHFIEDYEKRSRVKILCEREELYHIHDVSKGAEKVLTSILRLYTGLFTDYGLIKESEVAYHSKLSETEVYESLLELDRAKILDYIPRSGLPVIYVPTAREETHAILIGRDIYEQRKEEMSARIESVIDYTFVDKTCRVKRMLAYFGEDNPEDCGKCDVCREKKKNPGYINEMKKGSLKKVIEYLRNHPEGVRALTIESQCGPDKELTASSLSYLCNEGIVLFKDNLYFLT
ncbi:MAG: RecQ family ATP-dependent DNA helicase [Muribaculaceae bacterium]|nr:RecQ family ATP-dependent DNA helicase [Muribaculaceae bacterium]